MTGLDATLWRGDLLLFDESAGPDCRAYMLFLLPGSGELGLINYVGYKAGNRLITANIPREAGEDGAVNIRLRWLRDNWGRSMPFGSFETTRFYSWVGNPD